MESLLLSTPFPKFDFAKPRPRLAPLSPAKTGKKLTYLCAPSGFGKTILMSHWIGSTPATDASCSWHNIFPSPDRLDLFYSQLLTAFSAHMPKAAAAKLEPKLDCLIEASWHLDQRHIVFIDDAQSLDQGSEPGEISYLIEKSAPAVQFAISTRRRNSLNVSTLRAHDQATIIRARDLRFDPQEVRRIFGDRSTDEQRAAISSITDGWPAAEALLRAPANPISQDVRREDHAADPLELAEIYEFIGKNITPELGDEAVKLLAELSIFDTFTAKQALFLTSNSKALQVIEDEALYPLLYRTGQDNAEFGFNSLFRGFLHRQIKNTEFEKFEMINARASVWFEQNGDLQQAIKHAHDCGDSRRLLDLFNTAGGVEIGLREGLGTLSNIVDLLPQNFLESEPHIALSKAMLCIKDGDLTLARHYLGKVRQGLSSRSTDSTFHYYASIVSMLIRVYEGKNLDIAYINEKYQSFEKGPTQGLWKQGWIKNLECMAHYSNGEVIAAEEAALISLDYYRGSDSTYSQIYMHFHLGLIYRLRGELHLALRHLTEGQTLSQSSFSMDPGLCALSDVLLAGAYFDCGDFESAWSLIDHSMIELKSHETWSEAFVCGYLTLQGLSAIPEFSSNATAILSDFEEFALEQNIELLKRVTTIRKTEHAISERNLVLAERLLGDLGVDPASGDNGEFAAFDFQDRFRVTCCLARLSAAKGSSDDALALTDTAIADATAKRHFRHGLTAKLLKLQILAQDERSEDADRLLVGVLQDPTARSYVGAFAAGAKEMGPSINGFMERNSAKDMDRDQVELLGKVLSIARPGSGENDAAGILSEREFAVLRSLSAGNSNKVIARELDITEATVKFHLRSVFKKLGVKNRLMAVEVAKAKNVIENAPPPSQESPLPSS